MLVVYLPKEKVLAEPDAFTPPAQPGGALVRTAIPYAKALYDNIKRLNLDVAVIAPFHGNRKTDVAEVGRAGGVANATNVNSATTYNNYFANPSAANLTDFLH